MAHGLDLAALSAIEEVLGEEACEQPLVPVPGGLTNSCYRLGSTGPLLKLYGAGTDKLTDRSRERSLIAHLTKVAPPGTCKQLLVLFQGGHVEEWVEGGTLPFNQMVDPYGEQIVALMSTLHSAPLPEDVCPDQAEETFWSDMHSWADALPSSSEPSPVALKEALVELRELAVRSPVCICHRDVHGANILKTPSGALRLIDFEFGCAAPRAFDVANFFLECCFVEETEQWDWELEPTGAQKLLFAQAYAKAWGGQEVACHTEPEELVLEWDGHWGAVAHVWNVLWAMTIAHSGRAAGSDGFDYAEYARARWAQYLAVKAQ